MKIVVDSQDRTFDLAAKELMGYYRRLTGKTAQLREKVTPRGQTILLCDPDSAFAHPKVKKGSEAYAVCRDEKGSLLVLTAGRGRAAFYGVYALLEHLGCRFFWDGDILPEEVDFFAGEREFYDEPRFETRAIRYFAHRGLHRFQAEHWNFEDWKREIDWILKKKLNTFMLRIGLDDLFQKAFPDMVPYPSNEEVLPEATKGYNDRTLFWSLQFRGELRKKILDYAFERDLLHPEDCGTMTHWYSRTPFAFLDKAKPTLLSQNSSSYSEKTGLVWDIHDEKNLSYYRRLTDTHVREYGRPEIFHTIGLAERNYSSDRGEQLELKRFAYEKITEHIKTTYPEAPLWVASWDFFFTYKAEEVRSMIGHLDPKRHVIFDYTVDLKESGNDFENWGVVGKFPWIFGLFHAYQPQSHVHGDYEYLNRKLAVAAEDPFCQGMAFWPENSHADTLMLEYFTKNAWRPEMKSPREMILTYCRDRYGKNAKALETVWMTFMPLLEKPRRGGSYMECFFDLLHEEKAPRYLLDRSHKRHEEILNRLRRRIEDVKPHLAIMADVVRALAKLPSALWEDTVIRRDLIDLWRTVAAQKLDFDFQEGAILYCDTGDLLLVEEKWSLCLEQLELFSRILALSPEFSLKHTLKELRKTAQVNPYFENALKENTVNVYCRSSVWEVVRHIYLPEMKLLTKRVLEGRLDSWDTLLKEKERIFQEFKKKNLSRISWPAESPKGVMADYLLLLGE